MIITGFQQLVKRKLKSFAAGIQKHNDVYINTKYVNGKQYDTNCFVQWTIHNPYGHYKKRLVGPSSKMIAKSDAYQYVLNSNKPFLVSERGPLRQLPAYQKWGWTSYKNGIGIFKNENVDDYRWKKIQKETGIVFSDWASPGDNILIMGQKEGDSALIEMYDAGYKSFNDYIIEQIKTIRQYTDRPILVRPHPLGEKAFNNLESTLDKQYGNISVSKNYDSNTKLNGGKGLEKDLKSAYCVVTYSSNSAVEAIEKGIPVFTLSSTSSAYAVGHTDLSRIENLDYNIDISQWLNELAYTVWNEDEVSNGDMWGHLK